MSIRLMSRVAGMALLLVSQVLLMLDAHAAPAGVRSPASGAAALDISIHGSDVEIELVAPAATLVGFEHAPQSGAELETLRLARANLEAGNGMIRFNTKAECRLVESRVEADLPAPTSVKGTVAQHADIRAKYRFQCLRPRALDSAALGLFVGFPGLQRALVHYEIPEGRGAAELTRGNPVVSFIPF